MSPDEMVRLEIGRLRRGGLPTCQHYTSTGRDPLLNPALLDRSKEIKVWTSEKTVDVYEIDHNWRLGQAWATRFAGSR
jgi:hypothetical protein